MVGIRSNSMGVAPLSLIKQTYVIMPWKGGETGVQFESVFREHHGKLNKYLFVFQWVNGLQ